MPQVYAIPQPAAVEAHADHAHAAEARRALVGRLLPVEVLGVRYVRLRDPETGTRWLVGRDRVLLRMRRPDGGGRLLRPYPG